MAKHKKKCQSSHAQVLAHYAEEYSRLHTSALFMITNAHTLF